MKKIKGDKPIGVIIHIYMGLPQGKSLCSYLYFKQAKMSSFSFHLFSFFYYKIGEQESKTGLAQRGGLTPVGGEKCWGKGVEG
jgi:hypothetical protein